MPDPTAAPPQVRICSFGPVEIAYDERVLVPRPWTLLQSEWAAELGSGLGDGPILELCAGAGQIGLAAAALSGRDLVQVDADATAVGFAVRNAEAAGMGGRVEVRHARLQDAVAAHERFPLVLADPPYLPRGDVGLFPADPRTAIDGGADGLDLVRACLVVAGRCVEPGGAVLIQVRGPAQVAQVHDLLADVAPDLVPAGQRAVDEHRAVALLRRRRDG